MTNGRKRTEAMIHARRQGSAAAAADPNPDFEPGFVVPMVKIIIDGNDRPADNSINPGEACVHCR
jgi:hypothetical protein